MVSYDVRRTRLHAKAWLLHRYTGLHTAYVGSANLTATALGSGQEWMVKVCAADLPHVIEKFEGTFEALWHDPEFEVYDARSEASAKRLREALRHQQAPETALSRFFTLRPFPFQEEILDRLETERLVHDRTRNLVVAATGTGKTMVAAFDYQRQAQREGVAPRLLFLAHRKELLTQARDTFRNVLRDGSFGELLVGGDTPERWDHVFASVQSVASQDVLRRFGDEHFRYVVVDECHHAPAESYKAIVPKLRPAIMLGLTATPERTDGKSLLPDFDGHIAAELRIWHALERQLLVPFEYYGLSDGTDLTQVRMSRTGYETSELTRVYTGNDARVNLIVKQLQQRVSDPRAIRALAFCVSIEHADFMAKALCERGVPALSVHGQSPDEVRNDAPRRLRAREVNVLCTCDLYNEGVDLPFIDTLLLLRPTSSATLFLQQLGRGLRHDNDKQTCLVLDFIGHHRAEFRFNDVLSALTNVPKVNLARAVEEGFPFLPSGCVLQFDQVAQKQLLDSLRSQLRGRKQLVAELRAMSEEGQAPTLASYLSVRGRELEEIYRNDGSWTALKRQAGLLPEADPKADELAADLSLLLHVDEPARMRTWTEPAAAIRTAFEERRYAMLAAQLQRRGTIQAAEPLAAYLATYPAVVDELKELREVLDDRLALARDVYPVADWPLALHRHYKNREILAAVGLTKPGDKNQDHQIGILKLPESKRELLWVTLDKSDRSFSPSTRYRDFAISPTLFHWETQSRASVTSESGRRYIESPQNGWSFFLFVRTNKHAAYAFLGPARYVSHQGDRPIAITWRLEHPLPALLYQRYATLAQG